MKKSVKLIAAIAISGTGMAHAVPVTIGAYVEGGIWSRDQTSGGLEQNNVSIQGTEADYSYLASAAFTGGTYLPELGTMSQFDSAGYTDDEYVSAEAYAIQTYQYTGTGSQTYTIDLSLHGIIDSGPDSYIDAEFAVYSGTELFDSYTACGGASANYLQGFGMWSCDSELATAFPYVDIAADGETTLTDSISFTVNANETFMIYAGLKSLSFAGSADASQTLSMAFTDDTDLVVLGDVTPVPLPAAAWLLGSGILALTGVAGCKRRTRTS